MMDNDKKAKIFRYVILSAIIVIGATIQNTLSFNFQIGGARCFIIVPIVVAIGMFEEETTAGFLGLFAGILIDMVSGVQIGYNTIVLCVISLLCSLLVSHIMRSTILTSFMFNFIATVFYVIVYWLLYVVFKGYDGGVKTLFTFFIPSGIYTFALSPFIYSAMRAVRKRLM